MAETSVVFKKLNLKDQREIVIANAPASFEGEIASLRAVRTVAIDEDWSAVRFRRVGFIKTLSRPKESTLSAAGKARAGAAKSRKRSPRTISK